MQPSKVLLAQAEIDPQGIARENEDDRVDE